jgi:hypothetical protein
MTTARTATPTIRTEFIAIVSLNGWSRKVVTVMATDPEDATDQLEKDYLSVVWLRTNGVAKAGGAQ